MKKSLAVILVSLFLSSGSLVGHPRNCVEDQVPTIRIATFNIQVLGKTKASKEWVMVRLAEIIQQYDLVAVQEVKDASVETADILLKYVNEAGPHTFEMLESPRTGQQYDDRYSKEQYLFLYNVQTISTDYTQATLFPDLANDFFQREPYVAKFTAAEGGHDFVLINIHTKPGLLSEIARLHDVVEWVRTTSMNDRDIIVLGDLNAGCSYATPEDLDTLTLRGPEYTWIVNDDADTNLAKSSCAYDRVIMTKYTQGYTGRWGVDEAFEEKEISDHWPVWFELRVR